MGTAPIARAARPEPASAMAPVEAVWAADPPPASSEDASGTPTTTAAPDSEPTRDTATADRRPTSPPPAGPLPPADLPSGHEPPGHGADEPVGASLAPDAPGEPPLHPDRPAARTTGTPLDLAELLRRHVFPALAAHGALEPGDVPELVEPASPSAPPTGRRTPAPGAVTVQPGVMSVRQPVAEAPRDTGAPERPVPSEVHVHIDRLTVTRTANPAPPPPPPAAPRRRSVSDHAAYLARRRERR
ncbi:MULTISPECIES: hypothetical protein [Streptomyces]|uniref:hypothetical protein n=1 Tax=Streptomyces TaxID=1883 RepID=UPI000CF28049|nr:MULTISPECIES: hypothetical protein [Streptomyces]PPS67826.1 hypothetical protein BV882_35900 [Streptomyces sp. 46]